MSNLHVHWFPHIHWFLPLLPYTDSLHYSFIAAVYLSATRYLFSGLLEESDQDNEMEVEVSGEDSDMEADVDVEDNS